jgi:UDP-2,3-diacylglucosamine pyrophosphatase LpxH
MTEFQERIIKGLERVRTRIEHSEQVDINKFKMVAFSDHHRGQGDRADDFRKCKSAYHAALGYYLKAEFSLFLLGDVEELWECYPRNVIRTYQDTLILEKEFSEQGRLIRIFGNHDDLWQYSGKVSKHLKRFFKSEGKKSEVYEGYLVSVTEGGNSLGQILMVHGHQGALEAEKFSRLSKFFVRYIWRNLQRLINIAAPTPARDFKLRLEQEVAMHVWASQQKGLILIAGHTHHPIFSSESHEGALKKEIKVLRKRLRGEKNPSKKKKIEENIQIKRASLNWVRSKSTGMVLDKLADKKPCYFNTGCCSFPDGDITAIEIDAGIIRLVHWLDDHGSSPKKILQEGDLRKIFKLCQ